MGHSTQHSRPLAATFGVFVCFAVWGICDNSSYEPNHLTPMWDLGRLVVLVYVLANLLVLTHVPHLRTTLQKVVLSSFCTGP